MKPHELIAALMDREGLGSLPLAKRIGRPELQAPIWRFTKGAVATPARSTAKALADYFKIPVEAIYEEQVATAVAQERGVRLLAPHERRQARVRSIDNATLQAAFRKLAAMNEEERQRFLRDMYGEAPAPAADSRHLGSLDSGLDRLHHVKTAPTKKAKK